MLLALFDIVLAVRRLLGDSRSAINLPGWRWGTIKQIPLVAVSRPLHSGVCETRQDAGLPVLHSKISDSGLLRTRGGQQQLKHLLYIGEVTQTSVLSSTSMSGAEIAANDFVERLVADIYSYQSAPKENLKWWCSSGVSKVDTN